jgi:hypothetical protein
MREQPKTGFSRFWMNDVTLMKVLKIENRKSHNLFHFFGGIHGKAIIFPVNERIPGKK